MGNHPSLILRQKVKLAHEENGLTTLRHDEVLDVTAKMLQEVCHDVTVDPTLLPLEGDRLAYQTAGSLKEAAIHRIA